MFQYDVVQDQAERAELLLHADVVALVDLPLAPVEDDTAQAVAALREVRLRLNIPAIDLAALPVIPSYSISKAAAFSLTQTLRAFLTGRGVSVHAVLTGPVDTDMSRDLDIPKASPESVAQAIFDGVEKGEEDIFPDPMSKSMAESWHGGAVKALERQYASLVQAQPS